MCAGLSSTNPRSIGRWRAVAGGGKQLLFASVLTLTNVAKDAQAEVRRLLPQKFIIRTGWVAKGIH
ncbi:MAG: hypothetical protein HQL99_11245 [Magnetococcales bacterium]|nr:hypothetical protein [Magnetococcales bacterium]